MKVTDKHRNFIRKYLETGNATRSYMECMNNTNYDYCKQKASLLLSDKNIKEEVNKIQQELRDQMVFDITNIQKFWIEVMLNENEKMFNRMRASENLCRSIGGFSDKQDINLSGQVIFRGENDLE